MINVTLQGIILRDGNIALSGNEIVITITGHSTKAAKGNDIVCAGVSALAQSVVVALEYWAIVHSIVQDDGLLRFSIHVPLLNDREITRCESIVSVLVIGLNEIRKQYSQFLTINVNE
ncbi:MAG TPA: ribosomal-processing cysteine protease Prp [Spirochaetota bacterium]|nr:ribosomal-processing cysteine protease Prp [Spirochaetota bacterium]